MSRHVEIEESEDDEPPTVRRKNPLFREKSGRGESSRIPRESGASIGYAREPEPDQPRASESRPKTARPPFNQTDEDDSEFCYTSLEQKVKCIFSSYGRRTESRPRSQTRMPREDRPPRRAVRNPEPPLHPGRHYLLPSHPLHLKNSASGRWLL